MTSVVVVTKRAGFTLTLHSPNHHFAELRPSAAWLDRTWTEDVVVLDLGTASATAEAVIDFRARGHRQPVVVVANDSNGWDRLFADHPDLHLISLPIAPRSLISTVDRATRVTSEQANAPSVPQLTSVGALEVDGASTTDKSSAESVPLPRSSPPPALPSAGHSALAAQFQEAAGSSSAMDLVRDLTPLVGKLSRLPEVAEMTRVRCSSVVSCEASAVLVPDGDVWRVAAGDRLRPLEERVQVSATHWLITELVGKGHGLLIRDTDVARTKLSGAPLASWPNLLAMPVPDVDAVIVLARRDKPFGRADLTSARQSLGSAALQLREAVDIRALARALTAFVDPMP